MKKSLGFFQLIMINVIAVGSLRTLPFAAMYGNSIFFFYLVAAFCFFLPTALVSAELGTAFPNTGGIYVWVKEAFGRKCSFVVIWLNWIYNAVWYPTILAFISGTITYLFNPELAFNRWYMSASVIALFWISTWLNLYGMKVSSVMSTVGALFGTILPMILIACLGIYWFLSGHPISADFFKIGVIPNLTSSGNLAFLTTVLFGLLGLEMSATHAAEMKNPQKDYPKAVFVSAFMILAMIVFAASAISLVVPSSEMNLATGVMQAFSVFFQTMRLSFLIPVLAICVILGGISAIGAWVIGPTKGMMVALHDANIKGFITKKNKHGVPSGILITQAIVVSFLSIAFVIFPNINASFWFLSVITAQLALVVYIFLFSSALYLHYKKPDVARSFRIPFGKMGIWSVCLLGICSSLFVIGVGFLPPEGIEINHVFSYEMWLIGFVVLLGISPLYFLPKVR